VPQLNWKLSDTHAPALQRGPVQFWCLRQSRQLQPALQVPHEGGPHRLVSVFRTQVVLSVSVEVPVLQLLAPHAYEVTVRVRVPLLPQAVP
jgi:hypothetical protein